MKKLAILALGVLVAACSETPTEPPAMDAPPTALAAAYTETSSTSFPIAIGVFVPCAAGGAGELVIASGTLHVLFNLTITANGRVVLKSLFNPQQLSGEGLTTGDMYQGTGGTQETNVFGVVGQTFTFVNNFRFIGQGAGNNFLVHVNQHITVNADGTLTAEVSNGGVECR